MRNRVSRRIALASAAAVLAASSLGVSAAAASVGDGNATCSVSGVGRYTITASFTVGAGEAGSYYLLWRTDEANPQIIASRVKRFGEGPQSASATTRIGGNYVVAIVRVATGDFDYPRCGNN